MTTDPTPLNRAELADLLNGAAQSISGVMTAEYPTPASCSYLHPVLGALSAGPQVIEELTDRLEAFLRESQPGTTASLFTLASYASALGRFAESLVELTGAADRICGQVGIHAAPPAVLAPATPATQGDAVEPEIRFSVLELAAIRTAAEAAGLSSGEYIEVLSESLLAAARITDACMEIAAGLAEDAADVLRGTCGLSPLGAGLDGLSALRRTLFTRMERAQ